MIGVLIDRRYEIVQVLGGGAFGQTFLAKDTKRPGRPDCVIKQLRYFSNNPQALHHARRLFKKEAEILERLGHHDQIPTLLADIEEDQEFYLVEQFIPGQSLASEILPGVCWTEAQVIQLLAEVLKILVFVHGQGVIHRDLKPANLMRRESDGKLVLIDFGAVKELETQIAHGHGVPTIAVGTPGYMPIEQFNGQPQFNSDIYTLGIIAIQALLGLSVEELSGLKDPSSTPPGEVMWRDRQPVSPQLADILDRMVRTDFRQRYPSAKAALADLAIFGIPATEYSAESASATTMLRSSLQSTVASFPSSAARSQLPQSPQYPIQSRTETRPETRPETSSETRKARSWTVVALSVVLAIGSLAGIGYSQRSQVATFFYNQGREKARVGDISGAIDNYNLALQINPNFADAYARRCGSRLRLEDNDGAIKDCTKALEIDPNNAVAHLQWGNIYTEQRNRDEADKSYTRSVQLSSQTIQLNPNDADAYFYRGAARLRLADYRGAIADASQAIELDVDYADAYVTRCQAQGLLGNHSEAVNDCQKAIDINPNHYVAYTSLCNNFNNSGLYQEAVDACSEALQINPNDPHAYNNRGVVWFRLGDYQAAIEDYNQAIQRDPQDAAAYHNRGDALSRQGDKQQAIDSYTQAIQINPEFAASYFSRGLRYAETGNTENALTDLQRAAELYSQQGQQANYESVQVYINRIQQGQPVTPAPSNAESEPPAAPIAPSGADVTVEPGVSIPPSPNAIDSSTPSTSVIEEPSAPVILEPPTLPESLPPDDSAPVIEEPSQPIIEEPAPEPYYAPPPEEPGDLSSPSSVEEPPIAPVEEPLPASEPSSSVEEPPLSVPDF